MRCPFCSHDNSQVKDIGAFVKDALQGRRFEAERLRCDAVVVSDTTMLAPDLPSTCVGIARPRCEPHLDGCGLPAAAVMARHHLGRIVNISSASAERGGKCECIAGAVARQEHERRGPIVWHAGAVSGYHTALVTAPDEGWAVAVQQNVWSPLADEQLNAAAFGALTIALGGTPGAVAESPTQTLVLAGLAALVRAAHYPVVVVPG